MSEDSHQPSKVSFLFTHFVNIHGASIGKILPYDVDMPEHVAAAYFAGTSEDGLGQEPNEVEVLAVPDLTRMVVLPWRPTVAWAPSSLSRYGGPHPLYPRTILQQSVSKLRDLHNVSARVGLEVELYLLEGSGATLNRASRGEGDIPAYVFGGTMALAQYWHTVQAWAAASRINILTITHEGGRSQLEFSLEAVDPITAADQFCLFKSIIREAARLHGMTAVLMPRPFADDLGSGLHVNFSLTTAASDRPEVDFQMSWERILRKLLAEADAIAAIACPTTNSYRRIWAEYPVISWTSGEISWGIDDRTKLIRYVPRDCRIELRLADATTNIYLLLSLLLAVIGGGLDEATPLSTDQISSRKLPRTLAEALDRFEESRFTGHALGEDLKAIFLRVKRNEWAQYMGQVPSWEHERYLNS